MALHAAPCWHPVILHAAQPATLAPCPDMRLHACRLLAAHGPAALMPWQTHDRRGDAGKPRLRTRAAASSWRSVRLATHVAGNRLFISECLSPSECPGVHAGFHCIARGLLHRGSYSAAGRHLHHRPAHPPRCRLGARCLAAFFGSYSEHDCLSTSMAVLRCILPLLLLGHEHLPCLPALLQPR